MPTPTRYRLAPWFAAFLAGFLVSGAPVSAEPTAAARLAADASAAIKTCRSADAAAERGCYAQVFTARIASGGPASALELLDRLAALEPKVRSDGHFYAHHIGASALSSPAEVARVFASCTPGYQSGCYHGVIQSYFIAKEREGAGVTAQSVDALCADYRGTRADLLFQCTHGLGHGLAILQRHDLPAALTACDLLSREAEREMCYAGAFMESLVNATHPGHSVVPAAKASGGAAAEADPHAHHAGHAVAAASAKPAFRALDPSDLHYPCSAVAEKYLIACYTIQTSAMLHHTRNDVGRAATECGRAPEKARTTCFISLGRDVSTVAGGNNREAVRLCGLVEAAYRPTCHRSVAETLVNMNANPVEAIAYCRAVAETDGKSACYTAVGEQASVLPKGAEKREQACRAAEAEYREKCLGTPVDQKATT
ncbi:MAG TPA: hypothetical protein VGB48_08450 [Allosphingosinicella sp.]|jgi:hypothetical protein